MAQFFEMPQASPTMTSGVLNRWKKKEGDALAPQDAIAEVETDKAAMDVEVFDKGYLLKVLAAEGEEVPAGQPIAILGTRPDEDISALLAEFEARKASAPKAGTPTQAPAPEAAPAPAQAERPAPAPAEPKATPAAEAPARPARPGYVPFTWMDRPVDSAIMEPDVDWEPPTPRVRSSPAARRAAREHGLELANVHGTGPRGRVTRADVEKASAAPAPTPATPAAGRPDEVVRNSMMRKTIARRLTEVWQTAPVFYLTATFDCDSLVAFRAQLKEAELPTSYNVLVVAAVAKALRDVPEVNASWGPDAITRHGRVHVGVAVALDEGLITPVVRDADTRGLRALTAEIKDLADRARARSLKPEEYQGSTFTVSNLGMMEIEHFTAILNPPEAAILAVGSLQQEVVVRDGQVATRWRMRVTMTCDHRVVDGALGARFLSALRKYVEHPALLAG